MGYKKTFSKGVVNKIILLELSGLLGLLSSAGKNLGLLRTYPGGAQLPLCLLALRWTTCLA